MYINIERLYQKHRVLIIQAISAATEYGQIHNTIKGTLV